MSAKSTNPERKGRPTVFTPELEDKICEEIAKGKSLVSILKAKGMPDYSTVTRYLRKTQGQEDGFCTKYARAREDQADYLFDQILAIADDGSNDTYVDDEGKDKVDYDHIQRSKLRVDARKWMASKLRPKRYGESTTLRNDEESPVKLGVILYPEKKPAGAA